MTETERKRPGSVVDPAELRALFTDRPPEKCVVPPQVEAAATSPEKVPAAIPAAIPAATTQNGNDYSAFTALPELAAAMAECRRCPLCTTRKNVVFGEGPVNARLMFIGEGPGADGGHIFGNVQLGKRIAVVKGIYRGPGGWH